MPSSTISIHTLVNLGPLTTTFTAPESCITARSSAIGIAHKEMPWLGPAWSENCDAATLSDCLPSGTAWDEQLSSAWPTTVDTAYFPIMYYSPANACPSGWATVGSVEKDAEGNATTSWNFDPGVTTSFEQLTTTPTDIPRASEVRYLFGGTPGHVMWADALQPKETGIACCPSGYTPAPRLGCYSAAPLEEFTATSHCQAYRSALNDVDFDRVNVTVTAYDRTVTGEVREMPATALVNVTTDWREYEATLSKVVLIGFSDITTSSTSREEMRTAMYYQSMVLLASMPAEGESAAETATSSAEASGPEETDGDGSGAARMGGSAAMIGIVMAAWIGAMVLSGVI